MSTVNKTQNACGEHTDNAFGLIWHTPSPVAPLMMRPDGHTNDKKISESNKLERNIKKDKNQALCTLFIRFGGDMWPYGASQGSDRPQPRLGPHGSNIGEELVRHEKLQQHEIMSEFSKHILPYMLYAVDPADSRRPATNNTDPPVAQWRSAAAAGPPSSIGRSVQLHVYDDIKRVPRHAPNGSRQEQANKLLQQEGVFP
jgi:hypothetical protein